ncbi:CocE/NonD family hydrolase [Undibacterium terreum]|uniref:Peptidase S15 n=1 Tax=Undibacterium terreum TaxID=1224302 RepID=A0A916V0Y7_9BURK|nr:CocE/NonD family hydrolase [Undibacterium terreum]GGD00589.1 peptidase S15 [Undibacterium terreum]
MIEERDVIVTMRDGIRLAVDVYRPEGPGKYPVLYASALHNKDLQGPDIADVLPPQPAQAPLWFGPIEAGDTRRFIANGYIHVIAQPRGSAKSEGHYGEEQSDHYDMIEWITQQPWSDGKVGMVGISGFAGEQWRAAAQQHPALKAIFPYDACSAYGGMFGFRDFNPGGVVHTFPYLLDVFSTVHEPRGTPGELPAKQQELWEKSISNPDYKMYINLYNILTQKGQRTRVMYHILTNPWEEEGTVEQAEKNFKAIKIPYYTGSGAYAYTYKLHWLGAQHYFQNVDQPRKLIFTGPAHLERPFHQYHDEVIRWYDYWLKGIDTGIMNEPPVRYWVMGANEWRTGTDWPLPETQWVKYHLSGWERLTTDAPRPADQVGAAAREPDVFTQMPLKKTSRVECLRYMTEPLAHDVLVAGPISLTLYAEIDQPDTNWFVVLKDVGPDVSVVTARVGERAVSEDLPERELTRGWLKASYRATDPERSKPWEPFYKLTRSSIEPVTPGEIVKYEIQVIATANQFKAGHRICLEICSMDAPTGTGAMTDVEYIPYHVCSSTTVTHKIYRDAERPSHLLLPIIPLIAQPV